MGRDMGGWGAMGWDVLRSAVGGGVGWEGIWVDGERWDGMGRDGIGWGGKEWEGMGRDMGRDMMERASIYARHMVAMEIP